MKTEIINGSESYSSTMRPKDALSEFYDAFNNRKLNLMKNNWLQSEESNMSNPLGGIMQGWDQIETVYKRIFEGQAEVYVEFYDFNIQSSETYFHVVGRERGFFKIENAKLNLHIRTSRIFKKINNTWKQVHHHGSIDDPSLLAKYQRLVK